MSKTKSKLERVVELTTELSSIYQRVSKGTLTVEAARYEIAELNYQAEGEDLPFTVSIDTVESFAGLLEARNGITSPAYYDSSEGYYNTDDWDGLSSEM